MINIPLLIYYIIISFFFGFLLTFSIIPLKKLPVSIVNTDSLINITLQKEAEWAKALTNISLLILTASLASLFTPIRNNTALFFLIGLMAITSLFNLFFSVYIHICGFFTLSFRMGHQEKSPLNYAFIRLCYRLAKKWHLFPFFISLIQLIIAGHIIIILFFC